MAQGLYAQEARAFSARLKQALEAAGVRPSPAVVASEFNLRYWGKSITAHTARAWLAGLAIPTQDKIRTLSEWLHVNPDELRFGARSGPVLAMDSGTLESVLNLQDRQMLAQYLALPVGHRKTVQEVVAALAVAAARWPGATPLSITSAADRPACWRPCASARRSPGSALMRPMRATGVAAVAAAPATASRSAGGAVKASS